MFFRTRRDVLRGFIGAARAGVMVPAFTILNEFLAARDVEAATAVKPTFLFNNGIETLELKARIKYGTVLNTAIQIAELANRRTLGVDTQHNPSWHTVSNEPTTGLCLATMMDATSYSRRFVGADNPTLEYPEWWILYGPASQLTASGKIVPLDPDRLFSWNFSLQHNARTDGFRTSPQGFDLTKIMPEYLYIPPELQRNARLMRRFGNRRSHANVGFLFDTELGLRSRR